MRRMMYPGLVWTFYKSYQPKTAKFLKVYQRQAEQMTDSKLKQEALASLKTKAFHCYGASFYAYLVPTTHQESYLKFVTAYQTMCDYLDNLVDQTSIVNETNFRRLHQALLDVFKLETPHQNYYQYQTQQLDSGYLMNLVTICRQTLKDISHYSRYAPWLLKLAGLYVDLQVYKHLTVSEREEKLNGLFIKHKRLQQHLTWYEFSAACGSTLGIFTMVAYAMNQDKYRVEPEVIFNAMFPDVQQLHIMMDYLIDLEEDKRDGELNFFSYYPNIQTGLNEILKTYERAQQSVKRLPATTFHQTINDGLFALYLAEGVKKQPALKQTQRAILSQLGIRAKFLYRQAHHFVK